jgi:hypothetical protein
VYRINKTAVKRNSVKKKQINVESYTSLALGRKPGMGIE